MNLIVKRTVHVTGHSADGVYISQELSSGFVAAVKAYAANNERVNGIKHARHVTGFGLKDAKDLCDQLVDL
jgi:ribosomal protein L7/L12